MNDVIVLPSVIVEGKIAKFKADHPRSLVVASMRGVPCDPEPGEILSETIGIFRALFLRSRARE